MFVSNETITNRYARRLLLLTDGVPNTYVCVWLLPNPASSGHQLKREKKKFSLSVHVSSRLRIRFVVVGFLGSFVSSQVLWLYRPPASARSLSPYTRAVNLVILLDEIHTQVDIKNPVKKSIRKHVLRVSTQQQQYSNSLLNNKRRLELGKYCFVRYFQVTSAPPSRFLLHNFNQNQPPCAIESSSLAPNLSDHAGNKCILKIMGGVDHWESAGPELEFRIQCSRQSSGTSKQCY